ncbi:RNA-binding protein NOB1 [Pholidichthys leucotaenia]
MALALVEHVVADAGAFLKTVPLQNLGKNIYTVKAVVDEIRDRPTRRSLAFLPYQLLFKEPHPEHVRHVTEFSKKTGDYPSLSATDIKVLALTYQLELENVGPQHLKKEPEVKVNIRSTRLHPETPINVAGFHFPSKKPSPSTNVRHIQMDAVMPSDYEQFNSFQFWRDPLPTIDEELLGLLGSEEVSNSDQQKQTDRQASSMVASGDKTGPNVRHFQRDVAMPPDYEQFNSFYFWRDPLPTIDEELLDLLNEGGASPQEGAGHQSDHSDDQSDDEDKENEPEDDDDDDDEGWITPSNIKQVKMDTADWTVPVDIKVGCLTTDFAMQNVLIQMGLHVLSANGMVIKQARNHILRCHACFRTTCDMSKVFCPHCGNQTLKKVAVTVNEDGNVHMHFSRNPKVLNPRGLRHALPLPRGGKHANNPHLVEDQRFPQQRLSRKARQKTDVFDPDYVAGSSPFIQNDIYSRAANLHIRDGRQGSGRRRENPNAARRKFVKKK